MHELSHRLIEHESIQTRVWHTDAIRSSDIAHFVQLCSILNCIVEYVFDWRTFQYRGKNSHLKRRLRHWGVLRVMSPPRIRNWGWILGPPSSSPPTNGHVQHAGVPNKKLPNSWPVSPDQKHCETGSTDDNNDSG
jgi:hypothetical protein